MYCLASRFVPSGLVRGIRASDVMVSAYLFRLIHCHEQLLVHNLDRRSFPYFPLKFSSYKVLSGGT